MSHEWLYKDPLQRGGDLRVGERVFRIVRWTAPVRVVRFSAYRDGKLVAERARFTALLRDLERLPE